MVNDILDFLVAQGLVTESELAKGSRPTDPVRVMTIRSGAGEPPEFTFDSVLANPRYQLEFRDRRYDDAEAWAWQVWDFLSIQHNLTLGSHDYCYLEPYGSVSDLGADDNGHPLMSFNVRIKVIR